MFIYFYLSLLLLDAPVLVFPSFLPPWRSSAVFPGWKLVKGGKREKCAVAVCRRCCMSVELPQVEYLTSNRDHFPSSTARCLRLRHFPSFTARLRRSPQCWRPTRRGHPNKITSPQPPGQSLILSWRTESYYG